MTDIDSVIANIVEGKHEPRHFICDHCQKKFLLFYGVTLYGSHVAGCHLCEPCDKELREKKR